MTDTDELRIADGYTAMPYGDGYIVHHESGGAEPANLGMVAAIREIHRLRAELAGGPLGYATWKDAATAERLTRVQFQRDALRFRWLAERTAATGLERWVHPFQFLCEAVDERMKAGATMCD